jgi:DNA-binding CsgD family transcriptional regulator
MGTLYKQDYQRILGLVRSLDPAEEPAHVREAITITLMEMFGAYGGLFVLGDPATGRLIPTNSTLVNVDKNYYDQYVRYYWRFDPVHNAVSNGSRAAFRFSDTHPPSLRLKREFYNGFLCPQDIGAELVVCLRADNKLSGSVSLFRSTRDEDFAYRDVERAQIVSSYVSSIFRNAALVSRLLEEKARFEAMCESLGEGIIVLDHRLDARFWNTRASEICRLVPQEVSVHICHFGDRSLVVPDEVITDCMALKRGFEAGGSALDFVRQRIINLSETDSVRVDTRVFTNPLEPVSRAHFLVSMATEPRINACPEDVIQEQYNLTKRELEVIRCVSRGLTNQEIADKLFVSLLTVITHLKNIYRKVGVRNRTELVFRLQPAC